MRLILFFLFSTGLLVQVQAQYRSTDYNRLGLQAGYVIFDLSTENLETVRTNGFSGGFSTRGAFYNNFDLIYGIDFIQSEVGVMARPDNTQTEVSEVAYTLRGAQIRLTGSYLILGEHLSIEFGPVFMINSKAELNDKSKEEFILSGYEFLQAQDIQEWSRFNLNGLIGVTAGFERLRLTANYQYGVLNTLNRLNRENLQEKDPAAVDFKGNLGLFTAGIVFYL